MIIRLATDNDQSAWDAYVLRDPNAGPYHLYGWKTAVEQAYSHKGYYLLAEDGSGSVIGVLPLICFRMPWGRKTLVSLPYCDYGGPLGDPSVQNLLVNECRKLAQKLGASEIELRCPSENQIVGSHKPSQVLSHKVRMLLLLPDSSEDLWKNFKSKLRSQIRRPQKEGLKAQLGGPELLNDFYHVFIINMHALGSPVHARQWFNALFATNSSFAKVGLVCLKTGEPVAAGIILILGNKVCIPWASSLRAYNRLAPNMLLYWNFLKWAADSGFNEFDFGRSTPGEGTYRFKKQWGARPQGLHWYFLGSGQEKKENTDYSKETGRLRRIIATSWARMPLSFSNFVGPVIRKYISL